MLQIFVFQGLELRLGQGINPPHWEPGIQHQVHTVIAQTVRRKLLHFPLAKDIGTIQNLLWEIQEWHGRPLNRAHL